MVPVYLYGRRFIFLTDHQALTTIFHPEKEVPTMTAAWLRRHVLFLTGFDYSIEYKSTTKHCSAGGLFRPSSLTETEGSRFVGGDKHVVIQFYQESTSPSWKCGLLP